MNYFLNVTIFILLIITETVVFAGENVPFSFRNIISYYENYTNGEYSNQLTHLSTVLWSRQNLNDPQIVLTGEMSRIFSVCTHLNENDCHDYIHRLKPRKITIYSLLDTDLPKLVLEKKKRNGFKFEVKLVDLNLEEYLPFDETDRTYTPSLASDLTSIRRQKYGFSKYKTTRQCLNNLFGGLGSIKRSVASVFTSCFKGEQIDIVEDLIGNSTPDHIDVDWTEQQNVSGITEAFADDF